jgi:hypothetical protein
MLRQVIEAVPDPDASVNLFDLLCLVSFTGSDSVLASASYYYLLNPYNRFKTRLSSNKQFTASFYHNLTPNISLQVCVNAVFNSWDPREYGPVPSGVDTAKTGTVKTTMGLALNIAAD